MAFALYVHVPYCQSKCPYCDFNSYAVQHWPEEQYVAALCAELEHYAQRPPWNGNRIATVFFGGGTPSLFAAASLRRVLDTAFDLWPSPESSAAGRPSPGLHPSVEITLEANPGTVTLEKLRGLRAAANRISFGVQSFHARHLRTLGRIHSSADAAAAVPLARQAGFDNVGVDLIFGLPGQTPEEWERDLAQACALTPDHVSAYNLTYEEGTLFHKLRAQGSLHQLPEDTEVAMFTRARELLAAAGYEHYEISNYARPGRRCRHNLNYWRSSDYLGVGAGAHSYARTRDGLAAAGASGRRWSNERSPAAYLRAVERHGHARSFEEDVDTRRARGEFVFLGLRCLDGFAASAFRERFGADFPALFPHVSDLSGNGLLRLRDGRWQLTSRGLLLADSVFATFV